MFDEEDKELGEEDHVVIEDDIDLGDKQDQDEENRQVMQMIVRILYTIMEFVDELKTSYLRFFAARLKQNTFQ